MAKRGNPYRCRYCNRLSSKSLVCKRCEPKQEFAMKVKDKIENPLPKCRIQGCNKPVYAHHSGTCTLCEKHYFGEDIPLIRKSFVTDPNIENVYGGTPGAIPIRGGADEFHKKIEGWK